MPSGLENLEGNKFILRYEYPWGGIASNASREDIQPNQFVGCDGIFIRNGRLCSTNYYAFDPAHFKHSLDGELLYVSSSTGTPAEFCAIYSSAGGAGAGGGDMVVAIDRNCNCFYYNFSLKKWILDFSPPTDGSWVDGQGNLLYPSYSCSQMIKGIIYIFDWSSGAQYVYSPLNSLTLGTSFVGGKYCMTLDEYLIVCYTNKEVWSAGTQPSLNDPGVPPVMTGREYRSNRYNWSGAQEAYSSFQNSQWVTDFSSGATLGDITAGWNSVPEVQQEITGCFSMGNVGYILHDQGVTQLTPTASAILGNTAIQPFDSTLLWGGKDGVGCTMPRTLSVYGHLAIWGNNNGIYLFTGSTAPQEITGTVKKAMYEDINQFKYLDNKWSNIYGQIVNTGVDNRSPELVYNLYIVYTQPVFTQPIMMIIWSFVVASQSWTRHIVNVTEIMKSITDNENYLGVLSGSDQAVNQSVFKFPGVYGSTGQDFFVSPLYGGILINALSSIGGGSLDSFFLFQYINTGVTTLTDYPPVTNLTFRSEEFQIYRKPTVRGVILRAAGVGTLHVNINGYDFSDIVLDGTITPKLYRSFGMYTDWTPTLNINSTDFNGYITKVHCFGTYAEGEPI